MSSIPLQYNMNPPSLWAEVDMEFAEGKLNIFG